MEDPVSQIPFSIKDELAILSMSKWMKFVGIFLMIVGALGLIGLAFGALGCVGMPINAAAGVIFIVALVIGVGMIALVIWQGSLAYGAAERFELVVKSDDADQDYIAWGFQKLRIFFVIEAILAVLGALQALSGLL